MENTTFEDAVSMYFTRLFPFDYFYKWLGYGSQVVFNCREFAFNFDGERLLRYQSYKCIDDLRQDIKKLGPTKIDIGAVYSKPALSNIRKKRIYPTQKELIFDIDVTDYDDVRTCCEGTDMCVKCWEYMVVAVKILDTALREDFGFKNILWTFSGRRGVHGFVCDRKARKLKKRARKSVASYLQLINGGLFMKKKVKIGSKMYPSVKKALAVIQPVFIKMCVENQDIFGTENRLLKFLGLIADDEMREEVRTVLNEHCTSIAKWDAFVKFFQKQIELEREKWCETPYLIEEIMIQYAYPRLDINVTFEMSHLLKAPFCVHPKSGKIGIPIDAKNIENFDPFNLPTIFELLYEIDRFDNEAIEQGATEEQLEMIEDISKTSLKECMVVFENFLRDLELYT